MSSTNHSHGQPRPSPPYVRKTAVRAARSVPSVKTTGGPKVTFKVGKPKQSKEESEESEEDKDDMATSFLQFCAMCEKQIVIPNNAILYCSESCRRKDGSSTIQTSYAPLVSPITITPPDTDDAFGLKPRTILPAHLPTPRPFPAARISPQAHEGKSDLDPTEWKPNLSRRDSSDAFQYLSQFHRSGSSSLTPTRRPVMARSVHGATAAAITTPGLSYTPTASTSSDESLASTPYEFVPRPMAPAAYPLTAAAKPDDHTAPHVVEPASNTSFPGKRAADAKPALKAKETVTLGDLSYEKKWVVESGKPAAGSLRKLLDVRGM